ncbi:hypothetical protein CDAR_524871 [Caerostris darwini]|uniref:Uncharacterized protein n=1 Tax=Caerostris darwini TaxID=1538125 RepID=A0AAV4QZX3_9ARAC|nr:hypothetical protein CDAR_524871 [Caerostris darwini]
MYETESQTIVVRRGRVHMFHLWANSISRNADFASDTAKTYAADLRNTDVQMERRLGNSERVVSTILTKGKNSFYSNLSIREYPKTKQLFSLPARSQIKRNHRLQTELCGAFPNVKLRSVSGVFDLRQRSHHASHWSEFGEKHTAINIPLVRFGAPKASRDFQTDSHRFFLRHF